MPERQTSPAEVNADEVSPDGAHSNGGGPDGWSLDEVSSDGGHAHEPAPAEDPGPNDLFTPRTPPVPADPADAGGGSQHDAVTGADSGAAAHEPVSDGSGPADAVADGVTEVMPSFADDPAHDFPDGFPGDPGHEFADDFADDPTHDFPDDVPDGADARVSHADPGADAPTTEARIPAADAPTTEARIPASDPASDPADAPTEIIPAAVVRTRRGGRRALLLAGVVVALLAALYVADLVHSSGTVPRGVTVAGEQVSGLSPADAEQRVRTAVEPRTTRPIAVAVGDVTSEIDPRAAGLSVDWAATIRQAGSQPLNPFTRVRSFFTRREVGVVTKADADALDSALQQLVPIVSRPPAEGTVRFDGVTPVPVPPVDGQELDLVAAREVLERDWTNGTPVRLPVRMLKPTTTEDDVTKAVMDVGTPAVSGPVAVEGEKVTGSIGPEVIAKALSFRADPDQGLVPELDKAVVQEDIDPQLARSEQPGRDAAISFAGGRPVVTPSQDGRGVDYDATLKDLLAVLTKTGDERRITAVYTAQQAKLTTDELNGYGITEVMGEFTTGGFAVDSGRNIKRAAEKINGTIIGPGATFSLNKLTEPRDAAHGYVEAGVIQDGHASRDIGGGVSQVATTTYNAAYFAGMTDVTHKPHSFYISRYPPGREATVVSGPLDLKWRNDTPGGVVVQTVWTPSTLTVRVWGTKRYAVTSTPGPRTNPTQPTQVTIPAGEPCTPSQGAPGFTITDTRTLRDLKTGQVRSERRTTKYNPSPIVSCSSG